MPLGFYPPWDCLGQERAIFFLCVLTTYGEDSSISLEPVEGSGGVVSILPILCDFSLIRHPWPKAVYGIFNVADDQLENYELPHPSTVLLFGKNELFRVASLR